MKKLLGIVALLAIASPVWAAPAYTLSWDFEGDALGGTAAGWTNYTPSWGITNPANAQNKIFNASQYAPLSGEPVFDSKKLGVSLNSGYCGSTFTLPQATNSFVFETEMFTDIKKPNTGFLGPSGIKVLGSWNNVANAHEIWYEAEGNNQKNLRIGSTQSHSNLGRVLANAGTNNSGPDGLYNDDNVLCGGTTAVNTIPANQSVKIRLKMDYNVSEPGKLVTYFKALNYTSWRNAGLKDDGWIRLGATVASTTLATDPATGQVGAMSTIELHGAGWVHMYFDNVNFTSVPEPATLGLLLLGLPMLRRRR